MSSGDSIPGIKPDENTLWNGKSPRLNRTFFCFTDFIKDPEIYAILNDWLAWLPVVKSALYLCARDETPTYDLYWGLAVPEFVALRRERHFTTRGLAQVK